MNRIISSIACLVFSTVGSAQIGSPPEEKPISRHRIVVLDNDSLVEGDVERLDRIYRIRQVVGGDLELPADRVVAVVTNRTEAFSAVARRANLRDADERLRLARWCERHGLLHDALREAETAARMRIGFTSAENFAKTMRSLVERTAAEGTTSASEPTVIPAVALNRTNTGTAHQGTTIAPPIGPKPTGTPATPATPTTPASAELAVKSDDIRDLGSIDYNSESFPLFASKVNIILGNTCASCHARDDVKAMRLTRSGGRPGAATNLTAALPYVHPADWRRSPLLIKAITPHGGGVDAPLKSRTHPAYQTLESWVRIARAPEGTMPTDPPQGTAVGGTAVATQTPTEPRKLPDLDQSPANIRPVGSGGSEGGSAFGSDARRPADKAPVDEFDPAIFNRSTPNVVPPNPHPNTTAPTDATSTNPSVRPIGPTGPIPANPMGGVPSAPPTGQRPGTGFTPPPSSGPFAQPIVVPISPIPTPKRPNSPSAPKKQS